MKKKYLIISGIVVISIILLSIIIKVATDYSKENKIKQEIKEVIKYFEKNDYTNENLNKILKREVVKKGQYSLVEKSIKSYYIDLQTNLSNLDFLLSEDIFSNYLSEKNIKEDRPNFIKSQENIYNTKSQINEISEGINKQLNDISIINTYIADKDVSSYYKEFYTSLINNYITEDYKTKITTTKNNAIKKLDTYSKALEYLSSNKGHWNIENEKILFDDTLLYDEYLKIINNL